MVKLFCDLCGKGQEKLTTVKINVSWKDSYFKRYWTIYDKSESLCKECLKKINNNHKPPRKGLDEKYWKLVKGD